MADGIKKAPLTEDDIDFIQTPPVQPFTFETGVDCGVKTTAVSIPSRLL